MGKKAVKQYFNAVILTITVILFIFTFVGLYGGDVKPEGHTLRALSTLALPVIIAMTFLTLIYWSIRRSWFALIPILPLVFSVRYLGTIFQFGGKPDNITPVLTVGSYNVRCFNRDATGIVSMDMLSAMQKEGVDVLCMQEFDNTASGDQRSVIERYKDAYPYSAVGKDMAILSRRPIKGSKEIPFEYSNNGAIWADIQIDESHTVRVFNVHMETTGINSALHQATKNGEIDGNSTPVDIATNQNVRGSLLDSYVMNSVIRGGQAAIISNECHTSPHPTILCGDFNDVPYSYTYNTLLGNMTDGFREGGHGYGSTYHGMKGLLRIDYIFHPESMQSLDYYTVSLENSDHDPVISKLTYLSSSSK